MSHEAALAALDDEARRLGSHLGVDGPALLRERAQILGIAPAGTVSAGGTCRLLPARDGPWVAINLARRSDTELVAAWMGREWDGPVWDVIAEHLRTVDAHAAVERAQLLGIPAAVATPPSLRADAVRVTRGAPRAHRREPVVVDLSALWAGPLCTRLLLGSVAQVIKVELAGRPDGARAGHPEFWDRMNADKEQRTLEPDGVRLLLDEADVVVTSARRRALDQLGLELERRVHEHGLLWVAITGYGMTGAWRDRVAFGDDAAVAGGLAVAAGGEGAPVFVGDAVADPMAGMQAAHAAMEVLDNGTGAIVDISMRDTVAAALARAGGAGGQYPAHVGGQESELI